MKVFISQPMANKDNDEILYEREKAKFQILNKIPVGTEVEFINSFFMDYTNDKPLWFLGKSLQLLSEADVCYFMDGWEDARGCYLEHEACLKYEIPTEEL